MNPPSYAETVAILRGMKASLQKRTLTLAACLHENDADFLKGWRNVVQPTVQAYPKWSFEFLVADNSREVQAQSRAAVLDEGGHYLWFGGTNHRYAKTINKLVARATTPWFVYVCPAHCHLHSPKWLEDLLAGLESTEFGLAGHLTDGPAALPHAHIQGGVWAGRTLHLRGFEFSEQLPHDYSDVAYSSELERVGGELVNVPGVVSRNGLGLLRRQLLLGQLRRGDIHLLHLGRSRTREEKRQGQLELKQWERSHEDRGVLLG